MNPKQLIINEYGSLTPIQERVYPLVLKGEDLLITAPTGMGKTEAAFIPAIERILKSNEANPIFMLYITPLKALNRDMLRRLTRWAEKLNLRVSTRHGDTSQRTRRFQVRHPAHIFITTPETFQIMLATNSFREYFKNLKVVIVDEVHELIDNKRGAQLSLGLTRLRNLANYQMIGISATIKSPPNLFFKGKFHWIKDKYTKRPNVKVIPVYGEGEEQLKKLTQVLTRELSHYKKSLIFTNTRYMAELIGSLLIKNNFPSSVHHGSLSKEERYKSEDGFKNGKIKHLVCTSSLELGIDIGDVDLVINIGSPRQIRKGIQRIGRSGHGFNRVSKGLFIVLNKYDYYEAKVIAEEIKKGDLLEETDVIFPSRDVLAHSIVGESLVNYGLKISQICDLLKTNPLYNKLKEDDIKELLIYLENIQLLRIDEDKIIPRKRARRYYFEHVSMIPHSDYYDMIYNGKPIGKLSSNFADSLNEGEVFIIKGLPWLTLSKEEDRIVVDRAYSYTHAIPEWEGEQIPINYEVAKKVKKYSKLNHTYIYGDMIIIPSFMGSKINYALSLALSTLLSRETKYNLTVQSSPYAIILNTTIPISPKMLSNIFKYPINIKNEILSKIDRNPKISHILSDVLYHIGASDKSGGISPNFIRHLEGKLPFKIATNYFWYKYCDYKGGQRAYNQLRERDIIVLKELSPEIKELFNYISGGQIIKPDFSIEAIDSFLENLPKSFKFKCINCGQEFYGSVSNPPTHCPKCKSVLLAPLSKYDKKYSKQELMRRVSLYQSYKKRALIALSMYGVGVDSAMRTLGRMHRDIKDLVRDLFIVRDNFIRTKKYWKI